MEVQYEESTDGNSYYNVSLDDNDDDTDDNASSLFSVNVQDINTLEKPRYPRVSESNSSSYVPRPVLSSAGSFNEYAATATSHHKDISSLQKVKVTMAPAEILTCNHPNHKLAKDIQRILSERERYVTSADTSYLALRKAKKAYQKQAALRTEISKEVEALQKKVDKLKSNVQHLASNQSLVLVQASSEVDKLSIELQNSRSNVSAAEASLTSVNATNAELRKKIEALNGLSSKVQASAISRDRFRSEITTLQELYDTEVASQENKMSKLRSKQVDADLELKRLKDAQQRQEHEGSRVYGVVKQMLMAYNNNRGNISSSNNSNNHHSSYY